MELRFPNMINTLQVTGCHFGVKPPNWHYPRHHHHLFELLCCLKGEVVQDIHQDTITVREGEWLLINSGIRHASMNAAATEYSFFNVHFDLDDPEIRSLLGSAPYRHISRDEAKEGKLRFYVGELEAIVKHSIGLQPNDFLPGRPKQESADIPARFEDRILLQSYTLMIIHEILAHIRMQPVRSRGTGGVSLFAADIAHEIEEKLSYGLSDETSVTGTAKQLGLSRSQCTKLFSKVYGLSPRQYVSRQKLNMAKELLVTSNLPIAAIADRLGFRSASHFSRQFKRWTGQSPTEFKPRHLSSLPEDSVTLHGNSSMD